MSSDNSLSANHDRSPVSSSPSTASPPAGRVLGKRLTLSTAPIVPAIWFRFSFAQDRSIHEGALPRLRSRNYLEHLLFIGTARRTQFYQREVHRSGASGNAYTTSTATSIPSMPRRRLSEAVGRLSWPISFSSRNLLDGPKGIAAGERT